MGGIIESIDMNLGKLWDMVKDREAWRAAVHGVASSVQSLSCVRLFVTPRTAARQASLYITNSQSLLKLMSIESVMPSNHLTLCPSPSFPAFNPSQHQSLFK